MSMHAGRFNFDMFLVNFLISDASNNLEFESLLLPSVYVFLEKGQIEEKSFNIKSNSTIYCVRNI